MTPSELSRQIRQIVESQMIDLEATLADDAWKALVEVPDPYDAMPQIDVDLPQLRRAIRSLLSEAADNSPNRIINAAILNSTLKTIR
jgi:hypothetical protein